MSAKKNGPVVEEVGTFHLISPELQHSHMITVTEYAKVGQALFDRNLLWQYAKRRTKSGEGLEATYDVTMENHMVAISFLDQYNSQRCWLTKAKAWFIFKHLGSKTRHLEAVKKQIFIRYIGCGWAADHHAWSLNERGFTAKELFQHLLGVVLPLADTMDVHEEAPMNLPSLPSMPQLGTTSGLAKTLEKGAQDKSDAVKEKARETKLNMWRGRRAEREVIQGTT